MYYGTIGRGYLFFINLKNVQIKCYSFSKYSLFFLRSIAQLFTQLYMNCFFQFISWTDWVNAGKFLDNCWISWQIMADMKEVYDNLIIKAHKTCFACQSISILFIVLLMYNFDLNLLLHSAHCLFASCIYSGSSRAGPF